MANPNAEVAQRCFIVCIPKALPISVLKQTFCRFGDLIDLYLLPNKNCGYVKYASEKSAKKAMETLHGAEILNVRLKVMWNLSQTSILSNVSSIFGVCRFWKLRSQATTDESECDTTSAWTMSKPVHWNSRGLNLHETT